MPDQDFQDRLQRIAANSQAQSGSGTAREYGMDRVRKMNLGLFIAACIVMNIGTYTIIHTNKNSEAIRDASGIGTAVAIALAGLAATIVGIILAVRALPKKGSVVQPAAVRQPASGFARAVTSLIGLALGIGACLSLFMAGAARIVNPDTGNVFSGLALLTVLVLTFLAMLIGFVGLFLRGRSLLRVPLYYLAGVSLTYATFRLFRINLLDWPGFVALVQ
jgi:TRAP-type C4-dicarboxylate transport system permease small subunit